MENGQDTQERSNVDGDRETKRLKEVDPAPPNLKDFVLPEVLDTVEQMKAAYTASVPYKYAAIPQVFQSTFIDKAIDEIQHNSKVNFKESDLFRVYQSMDLANLTEEEHAKSMPNVWKLRNVLYSTEWRKHIEKICGLEEGTLIDKVDCACNCHIEGCHLLCHDDVIGTRKVSYIIYMTEEGWTAEEGGALELYDRVKVGDDDSDEYVPEAVPAKTVLPTRNSMAFFVVEPGVSFHAVQEVFGSRPRLSLQGWYHAAQPPSKMENATLQRLKDKDGQDVAEQTFQSYPVPEAAVKITEDECSLSESDKTFLSKFIQGTYLQPDSIQEIKKRFEDESSVQLREFLNDEFIEKMNKQISKEDDEDLKPITDSNYYRQGVKDGWTLTGPAHKQRYLEFHRDQPTDSPTSVGDMLTMLKTDLLESQPFRRYLAILTSLGEPLGFRGSARRFRRGLDYTVAHHGLLMDQSVLDATLCFVAGRGKDVQTEMEKMEEDKIHEADVKWQSGDFGGFECYISADDEEGGGPAAPADEYNEEDDTELLSVSASNNTLNLVYRDEGTMRFVKYVGSKAPSSRYDIAMVYSVEQTEEEEEEEEEETEGAMK